MPPTDNQPLQPTPDPLQPQPSMGGGPGPVPSPVQGTEPSPSTMPVQPPAAPAMEGGSVPPAPDMGAMAPLPMAPAEPAFTPAPAMPEMTPAPAPDMGVPAPMASSMPLQPQAPAPLQPETAPTPLPTPSPAMTPAPVVNDPTQPGYVPPANPTMAPMMSATGAKKSGSKMRLIRVVIAVVVSLVILSGGGLLLKDMLFTGSKITKADLVDDQAEGIAFQRPKQWTKPSDQSSTDGTIYTEDGKSVDESDQQMLVSSTSLGASFDDLPKSTQDQIVNKLLDTFSDKSKYEDSSEGCQEVGDIKATKTTQSNYTVAIQIEATCNKFTSRALKAKLKALVGIKGSDINIIGISAVDKTWDKSGDALDSILNSFKPAK